MTSVIRNKQFKFAKLRLEENHCHPNPCRNAGVCTEADGAFVCTCSEGFKGVNCEGKGSQSQATMK